MLLKEIFFVFVYCHSPLSPSVSQVGVFTRAICRVSHPMPIVQNELVSTERNGIRAKIESIKARSDTLAKPNVILFKDA